MYSLLLFKAVSLLLLRWHLMFQNESRLSGNPVQWCRSRPITRHIFVKLDCIIRCVFHIQASGLVYLDNFFENQQIFCQIGVIFVNLWVDFLTADSDCIDSRPVQVSVSRYKILYLDTGYCILYPYLDTFFWEYLYLDTFSESICI